MLRRWVSEGISELLEMQSEGKDVEKVMVSKGPNLQLTPLHM